MQISDEGLRLIKSFEGYLDKQPDGSCLAYTCPAGVATIGWGCTEGVKLGMRWTAAEAEAGLRREIAKHEAHVTRLVTVDINQNEFDALVSFCYNVGPGGKDKSGKVIPGLSTSTILKKLNAGDRTGAAQAFRLWNKGGGKVLPGLVSRRSREAALFLKPAAAPDAPWMPQRVDASKEPLSRKAVATAAAAAGTGATYVSTAGIPPPPDLLKTTAVNVSAWKGLAVGADPLTLAGLAIVIGAVAWFAYDKWRAE
ncbi:MAG: lysozyme [Desulfurellales bacterium]|nr:MAG: lysozyme [Desulfurellales bacterium]